MMTRLSDKYDKTVSAGFFQTGSYVFPAELLTVIRDGTSNKALQERINALRELGVCSQAIIADIYGGKLVKALRKDLSVLNQIIHS